jgi:hypothetical protein
MDRRDATLEGVMRGDTTRTATTKALTSRRLRGWFTGVRDRRMDSRSQTRVSAIQPKPPRKIPRRTKILRGGVARK